ncbi:type II secretion system inner membrane protein GspF [Myxococcota bacterium]|jgi:general secretion pathway protein F|nr:type II secretion system inner membrane protein GspF [Myxococcota bacterium]MBU1243926.1 type II secretion system inner membrane protein GspF [Myxococcota bacterium]MBU1410350.1 type II secretion system inner membrane protein GspF [Myxococcota bacterium]MBU1512017.1 type II secretion system inner membrane protein GspF [Myxococcota bacterium]PKN28102.1 MAG: type II secretion system protein GspF [Deltaproteobacteria bacterium HGW-Deltaproteobacteria-22]
MPVFVYKCLNASGKAVRGTRDADSEKSLRAQLRKEGLFLQEVKLSTEKGKGLQREVDISFINRVSASAIAVFTRQLATLLKAGVPLTESLAAIADQLQSDKGQKKLATLVFTVRRTVNEGRSLADALMAHPKEFNVFYVSMVRSGEASGNLDTVLFSLAEYLERQQKLKDKVSSAMTYPVIMVFITSGMVGLLMTTVVPNVVTVFEDSGQTLPIYTRLLIGFSNFISNSWYLLILGIIAVVFGFKRWKRSESGRHLWDRFLLHVPLVGQLVRIISIARFSSTLGTMLHSGVPILQSLDISRSVMGNTRLQEVVDDVAVAVREGESMARVMERSGEFPPLVSHMVAIGEKSGQLEQMLNNVAVTYDNEVETTLSKLTSVLEPLMILVMGGMVAFIVMSILMPIMQMNNIGV